MIIGSLLIQKNQLLLRENETCYKSLCDYGVVVCMLDFHTHTPTQTYTDTNTTIQTQTDIL